VSPLKVVLGGSGKLKTPLDRGIISGAISNRRGKEGRRVLKENEG
jgi:hypothetical protein